MADNDLRADLEAAFANPDATPADSGAIPDAPEADAVIGPQTIPDKPAEAPPATGERARNPDGTFAKATEPPAAPASPLTPAGASPPAAAPVQQPAAPQADRIAPPDGWKGAAKVRWEGLPKPVQQEIVADYARMGQSQQQLDAFQQVIGPRAAQLSAEYGSPQKAVEQLLALSDFAAQQPHQFLQWFARSRGIDLSSAAPQAQQPAYIDPALAPYVQPLQQKVNALEQQLAESAQAQYQAAYSSNLDTVQAFAADPAHPYANDVAEEMVRLITTGAVPRGPNVLSEAYDLACYRDKGIRAQMQEAEREKANQAAQLDKSRKAAVALNGSPLPGGSTSASQPDRSLRAELEAAFAEQGGRI